MRRLLVWPLLFFAALVHAQSPTDSIAMNTWTGTAWTPALTTATAGALPVGQVPPQKTMYCYNSGTGQWVPADNSCFNGGSAPGPYLPLAGGTMTGATGGAPIAGGINATALEVNGTNTDLGMIYNAIVDGGATGNGTTDDTAALTAGCKAATGAGKIFFIPAATYKVSGTVTCNPSPGSGNIIRIMGVYELSRIVSTSTTADILHLGNGNVCASPGLVCGFVEGLTLLGPTSTPAQNGQRALLLDDLTQFRVQEVDEGNTDIGFDLINNCYGAVYENVRGGFFGNNNVGLYMRTGNQSGNQIFVNDSWISGALGAVYMSPGADGLYITGGQYSMTNVTTATQGVFVVGIDYLTSATGGVGTLSIDGIDTEGAGGWWIYGKGTMNLTLTNSDFLANHTNATEGVMSVTGAGTSRWDFRNIEWGGSAGYAAAAPIVIAGDFGNSMLSSSGWNANSGSLKFNCAVSCAAFSTDNSMDPVVITNTLNGSAFAGTADYRPFNSQKSTHYQDGLYWQNANGIPQVSTNAASGSPTWSGLMLTGTLTKVLTSDSAGIVATTPNTGTALWAWSNMSANSAYPFRCSILWSQATATGGIGLAVQESGHNPTHLDAWSKIFTTNPASTTVTATLGQALAITTTTVTSVGTATPNAIGTVYQAELDGTLQTNGTAGTLNVIVYSGNASDAITIKAGSFCSLFP